MCVNTSTFSVNQKFLLLFGRMQKFGYSIHHLCEQRCLWNWLFEWTTLWAAVCCCHCDLFSLSYIVTCTRTFRTQVSYSSVVKVCCIHSVRSVRVANPTAVRVHNFPSLVMAVFASKICWSLQQLAMIYKTLGPPSSTLTLRGTLQPRVPRVSKSRRSLGLSVWLLCTLTVRVGTKVVAILY